MDTALSNGGPGFDRAASFRDPAGSLVFINGRILRVVNPAGQQDLSAFLESKAGPKLVESGDVVRSRVLDRADREELLADPKLQTLFDGRQGQTLIEHERVWFPSFPYEWPPEMLHAAGSIDE